MKNKSLFIDLEKIGFVAREYENGEKVENRCGRDFLYYVLNYYFPDNFNPQKCNPVFIEQNKLFGLPIHSLFVWTCLPFYKVPKLFKNKSLLLEINNVPIKSFKDFVLNMIHPQIIGVDDSFKLIEKCLLEKIACGIDTPIKKGSIMNHVLFVYGYDEEYLYVIDTHKVDNLEYEKITPEKDPKFLMKIKKDVIRKLHSKLSRVWVVKKLNT